MRLLDFISGSSSIGERACSHVKRAVRFRPFLEETGSEGSDALSRAARADESAKEDIFNEDLIEIR
jgi:hypothetical protein